MKVRLNRSHLDDRLTGILELRIEPIRIGYVPKDEGDTAIGERGLPEYVLTYRPTIPTPSTEPELYAIPHELDKKSPDEFWLKYQKATVILVSEREDDRFRNKNKDLIERIEALYVE